MTGHAIYRQLYCDWCERETGHDTNKSWFHCRACKRCYTCQKTRQYKCQACWDFEHRAQYVTRFDRVLGDFVTIQRTYVTDRLTWR